MLIGQTPDNMDKDGGWEAKPSVAVTVRRPCLTSPMLCHSCFLPVSASLSIHTCMYRCLRTAPRYAVWMQKHLHMRTGRSLRRDRKVRRTLPYQQRSDKNKRQEGSEGCHQTPRRLYPHMQHIPSCWMCIDSCAMLRGARQTDSLV